MRMNQSKQPVWSQSGQRDVMQRGPVRMGAGFSARGAHLLAAHVAARAARVAVQSGQSAGGFVARSRR
eukprot:CAMPEP_0119409646 /NCGR_PEP_ID=MMETSP1335-20130426/2891_1 /TAXON_ID=259385 /ORGANISM="Chrysoculter rhomboideus, Strain RCC1486" /LENGTH=67 /DNA_ID=CAMNT_0007434051 /DNA_START=829 /DNA_END=1028 /DNA_ORIENTATION=-